MTNENVAFFYQNVGYFPVGNDNNVAFFYQNIGLFGRPTFLGRVVGLVVPKRINVAFWYQNVFEYVSGALRTSETDDSRLAEDGTERRQE